MGRPAGGDGRRAVCGPYGRGAHSSRTAAALSWRLRNDKSIALSFIGESLRPAAAGADRAAHLGQCLLGETFLGDVEHQAATLSADQEPWSVI